MPQNLKSKMIVSPSTAKTINSAIEHWKQTKALNAKTAESLKQSIKIQLFDWKKLACYAFITSIVCLIISVSAVLADEFLRKLLAMLFTAPYYIKFMSLSLMAAITYLFSFNRMKLFPEKVISNSAILFIAVLLTGGAIYQLKELLTENNYSWLLLLSFIVYGIIGWYFNSNFIWVFALLSLGGWFGAETGYMSGWGSYFLSMNYPLRFVCFGGVLTAIAIVFAKHERFSKLERSTLTIGLLYLFIALWIMSIFGNYGDLITWHKVAQIELFHWSLLMGLVSGCAIYYGLKQEDAIMKGFGLTFLFINLYTRFFEYFWNSIHKAIFFLVLAGSFWLLGTKAETLWNLVKK